MLMRGLALSDDPKGRCLLLLQLDDNSSTEWQLGKTKVSNIMFSGYSLVCTCVSLWVADMKYFFHSFNSFIS